LAKLVAGIRFRPKAIMEASLRDAKLRRNVGIAEPVVSAPLCELLGHIQYGRRSGGCCNADQRPVFLSNFLSLRLDVYLLVGKLAPPAHAGQVPQQRRRG